VAVAAEEAVRHWVNGREDLVGTPGEPGPLARGAYLIEQRSPAHGAYAVINSQPAGAEPMVAEPSLFTVSRITATIRAGTIEAAGAAAEAYVDAVRTLTGAPVPCGDTGVTCRGHDNLMSPQYLPQPADSGEQYAFSVTADFILQGSS